MYILKNHFMATGEMSDQLKLCEALIEEFFTKKHSRYAFPFLMPVDTVEPGLHDYFDVIKKPMDFGTVKKKLENSEYQSIGQFAEDVRQIFRNCYIYNQPDTDVVKMAKMLEHVFERRFASISGQPNAMGDYAEVGWYDDDFGEDESSESDEASDNDKASENSDEESENEPESKRRRLVVRLHVGNIGFQKNDSVSDESSESVKSSESLSGDEEERKYEPHMMGQVGMDMSEPPSLATDAVLVHSEAMPEGSETVRGYDFNNGLDYHELLKSYKRSGFQALNFGKAVEEINKMIDCRLQPIPEEKVRNYDLSGRGRPQTNCTIFLAYTSNLISSGLREIIRYLVQHNMVDCLVTTAGGIEEDFIKCMASTYLGDFTLKGKELREKGINRIGNLLVPNDNYCKFEDWLMPILNQMVKEQKEENVIWTPSKMIDRLGREINHPDSVYYWAHKNNIPVFCPAITDGSLGDIIYFHSYKNPGLILDLVQDIRGINSIAVQAVNSGMIIVGGGVIKHHTANANLMRNGADYCVYLNTASEFDGSDSGARPDEAVSWGKIKKEATPVKIYGEATLVLPLLVAETFARREKEFKTTPDNG